MFSEPMAVDRKINEVSQGLAKTFIRKIYNDQGYPITGFDGTETFEVTLWPGDTGREITSVDTLTASWSKPADGEYIISVPGMDIVPGIYSIRAVLDPKGSVCYDSPREVFRGYLKVNASPGAMCNDPMKSYCTYADLLEKAPFLEQTFSDTDMSGFSRQRYRARQWVDMSIMRNAPNTSNWNHSNLVFYGVFAPGVSSRGRVADLLDSNKLILTRPIVDAAAHYAIFLICDALNATPAAGGYGEIAQKHYSRACSVLDSAVAEFSTSGSGSADFAVDMRLVTGRV